MLAAARDVARNMDFGRLFRGSARACYEALGWREIENPVEVENEPGRRESGHDLHECVMICPGRRALGEWPEGKVDLNGPDW